MVGLFGMTNVPFAIWIDDDGTIVRPAEIAFAPRQERGDGQDQSALIAQLPERQRKVIEQMTTSMRDTERYAAAVRDWAERGADSRYVLSEAEVVERSRPRPPEFGLAAAHFELGQHLHRAGHPRDAVPHFQEAHRLDPTNWSYHREALSLVDPSWGQVYERDMLSEVEVVGADTFYPPLDM
jgi:Tetratricopeptide repeat